MSPSAAMAARVPFLAMPTTRCIATEPEQDLFGRLRAAESIGRPLGDDRFLSRIERRTGRVLKPAKRGPKPLEVENG